MEWHQKFITTLGQVGGSHEEMMHRLVKETDLGNEMEKIVTGPRADSGDEFEKASGDVWNILIGKAERRWRRTTKSRWYRKGKE